MIIELKGHTYFISLPPVIPLDVIAKIWVMLTVIPSAADNSMNKADNAFRPLRTQTNRSSPCLDGFTVHKADTCQAKSNTLGLRQKGYFQFLFEIVLGCYQRNYVDMC